MRFAIALVALVAAAVLIVAGVAQRTFLNPPTTVSVTAATPKGLNYVVIPGSVLRAHTGQQRLHLEGSGTAFAAYGRTADVAAWLSGERYAQVRVAEDGTPMAPEVRTAPSLAGVAGGGSPDPDGSDLWIDQRSARGSLDWTVNLPSDVSLIIASDGASAAPSDVRITWPVPAATASSGILLVTGGALGVIGLLLYVWALVQVRRRRGPRRKSPPKAPRRPQPPKFRPQKPVATGPGRGRRSVGRSTVSRMTPAVAVVLATGLVAVASPRPAEAAERAPQAAVAEQQALRIVHRVAEVAEEADADRDATRAATRFDGPALALRKAAYTIRKKDKKAALPASLPIDGARTRLILPESTSTWPRTLFVVVEDRTDRDKAPIALAMVQDDPRSEYKAHYAMELQSGVTLPNLPSALLGAKRLDAENTVLRVPPARLADDYGALLREGDDAPESTLFATRDDQLVQNVGEAAKKKIAKKLGSTAGITFSDKDVDPSSVVALATADAGALVSVNLEEKWTVKPKRSGVTVRPSGGTKILAKVSSTGEGIQSVYGYQLLFAVPSAGSDQPVQLLGYAQGLVSAKEL